MYLKLQSNFGNLPKDMQEEVQRLKMLVSQTVHQAGARAKNEMRDMIRASGLGTRKFPTTIQQRTYPDIKNKQYSANAATQIYSVVPKIMESMESAITIKARNKKFLAVATELALQKGARGFAKEHVSPQTFEALTGIKLRLVMTKRGAMLVADNIRISTGKRRRVVGASNRALKTGKGLSSAVLYQLVPVVRTRKRFDFRPVIKKHFDAFSLEFDRKIKAAK